MQIYIYTQFKYTTAQGFFLKQSPKIFKGGAFVAGEINDTFFDACLSCAIKQIVPIPRAYSIQYYWVFISLVTKKL